MRFSIRMMMLASATLIAFHAHADSIGYYFTFSNELVDLPYEDGTYYAGIDLECPKPNHLDLCINPFSSPGENDCMGNYVNSPLVATGNFGIQKFAMDSSLLTSRTDFDTFMSLYDILLPERWRCVFNGQVSEFGRFEFINAAAGSREDSLIIYISPKPGMDLTGYEFDSVSAFVEPNAEGYYFAAHIAGFTTDPGFWENGYLNPESAYFAVGKCPNGDMPIITPEPACAVLIALGAAGIFIRKKL